MALKEEIQRTIRDASDQALLLSYIKTYRLQDINDLRGRLDFHIEKCRRFLSTERHYGTINRPRREYTKKLEYFMHLKQLVKKLKAKEKKALIPPKGLEYFGLNGFNAAEIREIRKQTTAAYNKLKRKFKKAHLVVNVKKAEKQGSRCRYAVRLRLEDSRALLLWAKHHDFELARALHRTIDNIQLEAQHKFKREVTQRRKKKF